jgi:regulator of RNase E activity RraA
VVAPGDLVEVELLGATPIRNRVVESPEPLGPYGAKPEVTPEAQALAHGTPVSGSTDRLPHITVELLRRVATATLSAQLHKRGIAQHVIDGVRPARPDLRMVGLARTLRYLPLREDVFGRIGGGDNAQKRAVDSLRAGEVLVIDCREERGAGTIGDILVLAAMVRGAAGVVTDGAVRDSAAIAALDLPSYSGGNHPAVLGRRHVPVDVDLPVSCGGCLVLPGDVLVGDADGVVVIPRDLVVDVADAAAAQEREEGYIAERVRAGDRLLGLYPMDGIRRQQYDAWLAKSDPPGGDA